MPFKDDHPLEKRVLESRRIKVKYPDRLPVIVEKQKNSDVPQIDKAKYLVPKDLSVGQFIYVIRKRLKLTPEKAIFVFVENHLPSPNMLMGELYNTKGNEDGYLYFTYSGENVFG